MALPQQYVYLLKLCQLDFCTRQDDNFWLGPLVPPKSWGIFKKKESRSKKQYSRVQKDLVILYTNISKCLLGVSVAANLAPIISKKFPLLVGLLLVG